MLAPSATAQCTHATLKPGERCPGCGKLYSYLAAKGQLGPPPEAAPSAVARAWLDHPLLALFRHRRRAGFFRQLQVLLKAGEGLPVIFTELRRSASSDAEKKAIDGLRAQVDGGATLVAAARLDPLHFDPLTLDLMAAAEPSGTLVPMLQRVIDRMEAAQQLRWKTILSSLYPMYLVGALLFVGPLMELPAVAAKTGSANGLAAVYCLGVIRNLVLAAAAMAALVAAPLLIPLLGLEMPWDRVRRGLPLIGKVVCDFQACRFCETFAAAASAGLDADRMLSLSLRATGSPLALRQLDAARAVIGRGGSFADAVGTLGLLDGPALGQFASGERVGGMDQAMETLGREYADSASRRMKIVTVVGIVGVIALGLVIIVVRILGVFMGTMSMYDGLLKG